MIASSAVGAAHTVLNWKHMLSRSKDGDYSSRGVGTLILRVLVAPQFCWTATEPWGYLTMFRPFCLLTVLETFWCLVCLFSVQVIGDLCARQVLNTRPELKSNKETLSVELVSAVGTGGSVCQYNGTVRADRAMNCSGTVWRLNRT